MQGTAWHYSYIWELKEKDEFEYERIKKKHENKNKKKQNSFINHVELSKKSNLKDSFKGNFIIKFDGEEEKGYIIGYNISEDAPIVREIYYANVGDTLVIDGEKVTIIEKNMK